MPVPGGLTGQQWRRQLAWRHTDETVRKETGIIPLSVAADRIGHAAMRCAGLLARLGSPGSPVSRDGSGTVTEVYPAASLKQWGLAYRGYKQPRNPAALPELVSELQAVAPWLDLGPHDYLCRASHDALDAVIAALTARAGSPGPDSPARSRTAGRSQPRRPDRASHRAAHRTRVRGTSLDSSSRSQMRRIADSARLRFGPVRMLTALRWASSARSRQALLLAADEDVLRVQQRADNEGSTTGFSFRSPLQTRLRHRARDVKLDTSVHKITTRLKDRCPR